MDIFKNMKNKLAFYLITASAILIPSLSSAQYFSGHNWQRTPSITPTSSPNIIFPVQGGAVFGDDFGDPRSGGRTHEGNDLLAAKMTPILAARGGRIVSADMIEPSYGYMISLAGDDGYKYSYLHINNDTPGTDDDLGGPQFAYAPGIQVGTQVTQSQHIAWVGDSGNAEATVAHLHFEIRLPDDTAIDPYPYLDAALKIFTYNVAGAKAASLTINSDKGLIISPETVLNCEPGSLIRTPLVSAVYYCGSDGKRYVFPNANTYNTWYQDFSNVKTISSDIMSKISLGGNVTYRPGVKLLKIPSDSRVYAVDHGGILRLMTSASVATKYYGSSWAKNIDDISEAFFTNYTLGNSINN